MSWKKFVSDYLTFSKKDRIAVLLFLSTTFVLYLFAYLQPKASPAALQEDSVLSKLLDTATQRAKSSRYAEPEENVNEFRYEVSEKPGFAPGMLFNFDPNTLNAAGWKKLGLHDRVIKTILNYRAKGGHFYKDADLKKIWGLPNGFYDHVKEYIRIAETKAAPASNFFKTPYTHKERVIASVDVNTADTTALISLPGIGSKLAQRIIAFRNKLGGFYSVEQIRETYGLPDSTFEKLKPYLQVHGGLKTFNINTTSKDELKGHPYIKWPIANAVVEYRNQHGPFKKLEDLKKILLIDDETYQRIAPYLSL